jgi:hypothetical protein
MKRAQLEHIIRAACTICPAGAERYSVSGTPDRPSVGRQALGSSLR